MHHTGHPLQLSRNPQLRQNVDVLITALTHVLTAFAGTVIGNVNRAVACTHRCTVREDWSLYPFRPLRQESTMLFLIHIFETETTTSSLSSFPFMSCMEDHKKKQTRSTLRLSRMTVQALIRRKTQPYDWISCYGN